MSAPSRHLPLSGLTNFRDLGGYTGHGGRTVRWRRIFRSDHLAGLTPDGQRVWGVSAEAELMARLDVDDVAGARGRLDAEGTLTLDG